MCLVATREADVTTRVAATQQATDVTTFADVVATTHAAATPSAADVTTFADVVITTHGATTTAAAVMTSADSAVSTTESLCGHVDDFTPPSFTPGSGPQLTANNDDPFDVRAHHIRNNGDPPVLRATIAAGETHVFSSNTAGLWFFSTLSGRVVPIDGADPPCYVVF